jgi:hypothetical protein
MKFSGIRAAARLGACLLAAAAALVAGDGRDFAGFFSLAGAHPQGNRVEVTLRIQVFNNTGGPVADAAAAVHPEGAGKDAILTLSGPHLWREGEDVVFSGTVTVERDELERWSAHGRPSLFLYYTDSQGQPKREAADLIRRPQVP